MLFSFFFLFQKNTSKVSSTLLSFSWFLLLLSPFSPSFSLPPLSRESSTSLSSCCCFFILLSLFIILHSSQFHFPYSSMNPHMDNISLRNTCIQLFLNASLGNSLWTCSWHQNGIIGFTLAFFTIYMGTGWIFLLDHELRGWKQMDRKNVMTWLNFSCRLKKSFHRYYLFHCLRFCGKNFCLSFMRRHLHAKNMLFTFGNISNFFLFVYSFIHSSMSSFLKLEP